VPIVMFDERIEVEERIKNRIYPSVLFAKG
jgi:hypothetical protein